MKFMANRSRLRTWGEGPSVLLCHGWGGRGTQFFALIEALVAAGYRAIAFDAPAHGDSSGKRTNMLMASKTIAGIVEREAPISAVIGHSFGCGIALLAIDRHQIPSDKVILFSCFTDTLWISQQFRKGIRNQRWRHRGHASNSKPALCPSFRQTLGLDGSLTGEYHQTK